MSSGAALVLGLFAIGFGCWIVFTFLKAIWDGVKTYIDAMLKDIKANRKRRDEEKAQAEIEKEKRQIEDFRNRHPVQVVGTPNIGLLQKISSQLDDFIATAKSYRPQIQPYEGRFRSVSFSYPFEIIFPRKNSTDNGPDPMTWETSLNDLEIKAGCPLRPIYEGLASATEFPAKEPSIAFDRQSPSKLPSLQLPSWSIKIIENQTRGEIDVRVERLAKAYAKEIEKADNLRNTADTLQKQIKQKWEEAKAEQDVRELFLKNQDLKFRELQRSVSAEYQARKKHFELKAAAELEPIRKIYQAYSLGTKEGIEQHFGLGLETIVLPLPPGYPWRVFYDRDERLIQINQRVPFSSDVAVKRTDSKRPLAKRDIEHFLRRLVPAISLHIASNVAANDWHDHVEIIAVNCWSRYFEKTTGKLKDAFVSAVKTDKKSILGMNINKADALDAFRALRGAFVYSTEDIVPIEPQIRLDKSDKRFVAGRDILDGMAQGQNLATMDWQDFEHLIREVWRKSTRKKGRRCTGHSRDNQQIW